LAAAEQPAQTQHENQSQDTGGGPSQAQESGGRGGGGGAGGGGVGGGEGGTPGGLPGIHIDR